LVKEEKQMVTARVDSDIVSKIKTMGVPLSRVIEAGLYYFVSLEEEDQKLWLLKNSADVGNILQSLNEEEKNNFEASFASAEWSDILTSGAALKTIGSAMAMLPLLGGGGLVMSGLGAAILASTAKNKQENKNNKKKGAGKNEDK
jgi:post-segregation antitoxin (ccd killing protein)